MRFIYTIIVALLFVSCISIKADVTTENTIQTSKSIEEAEAGIRLVMEAQEIAWNKHDLEGFMKGYWNNDALKFYGSKGLTKGWQNTLDNYKSGYPTKAESGTLNFVINDISNIEGDNYWVMGEYHLKRDIGNADGVFIIIFKKINGEWKIVADMSC
ncbi:nuclear transport factor 2 family protein [Winogradskyella sp.]|nr:nuclear transport factor 2 family protein [Winogradskyella sp.]MDC0007359.1 nuclear transport factor 2 family protein [Winogradskyella sp.]MDC0009377.1 nuclear transport factor 2 family protein [Winogradskyella sp.]MDC1505288.1 nuclear transport factor 2 family protein [Winogradskyella sp.]